MTRIFLLFALLALLSGCMAEKTPTSPLAGTAQNGANTDGAGQSLPQDPAVGAMFGKIADAALGVPYKRGGTSMNGFDCSGFVQWTYRNMGIAVPRTAREQSQTGRPVLSDDLRIGDIVAFHHPRRGWHSGIYMGGDRFVHSPNRRDRVRYSSLNEHYYRANFVAARRVLTDSADLDFAAAEQRLALARSEKRLIRNEPAHKAGKKNKGAPRAVAAKSAKAGKNRSGVSAGMEYGGKAFPGKDGRGARI